jgi:hypothetical protein
MAGMLNIGGSTGPQMVNSVSGTRASEREAHLIAELKRTVIFGNIRLR